MSEFTQRISDLSWAGMIPVIACLFAGVLLWCAGRRILRKGLMLLGAAVGGLVGWSIGSIVQVGPPAWVFACAGAIVLATLAWASYRLTLAGAMALLLGAAAPASVVAAAGFGWDVTWPGGNAQPQKAERAEPAPAPTATTETAKPQPQSDGPLYFPPQEVSPGDAGPTSGLPQDLVPFVKKALGDAGADNGGIAPDIALDALKDRLGLSIETRQHVEQATNLAQELLEAGRSAWEQMPPKLRPALIASAIGGVLAGIVLGGLAAGLSASVLTAGVGSGMAMVSGNVLATNLAGASMEWRPSSASSWAALWLITTLVGIAFQWITRPRPADKSA